MAFTTAPSISTRTFTPSLVCNQRSSTQQRTSRAAQMTLGKTVKETLQSNPNFKTLLQLADAAGVDLDVSNCTVFAPSNRAFSRLREGLVAELLADPVSARAILLRHILPGHVLTSKMIKGSGFWDGVPGGPLPYEAIGPIVKIASQPLVNGYENDECDNGVVHTLGGIILDAPLYKPPSVSQYFAPSIPNLSQRDSIVAAVNPQPTIGYMEKRALGAASKCSTVGGRKAMGLIKQLPFWQYGPPFNAAKQEDYEPISIAQPGCSGVNYELMPPGTVIVDPQEVSAAKLIPISGMSKYIGTVKRMVGGDALSNYSRLD